MIDHFATLMETVINFSKLLKDRDLPNMMVDRQVQHRPKKEKKNTTTTHILQILKTSIVTK